MAKVEVDLSEYDMLRDSLKEAKAQNGKLEEELKELNKKLESSATNVLVKTSKQKVCLKVSEFARLFAQALESADGVYQDPFYLHRCSSAHQYYDIASHLLTNAMGLYEVQYCTPSISIEGFDSVKAEIEAELRKGVMSHLAQLESDARNTVAEYHNKCNDVETEISSKYIERENFLKEKLKSEVDKREKIIAKQKETISLLSKSAEQQRQELIAQKEEIERKLGELQVRRRSFLDKLLKRD